MNLDGAGRDSETQLRADHQRRCAVTRDLFDNGTELQGNVAALGQHEASHRVGRALAHRSTSGQVHAGHALDLVTAETIATLPEIVELNIGHFLVGEAIFGGLTGTVKAMRAAMDRGFARR